MEPIRKSPAIILLMIVVAIPVVVRTALYVFMAVKGFGVLKIANYVSIVINLVMYLSIMKYAVDYFVKGRDVSLNGLVFRFGIAALTTVIGLREGCSQYTFILAAVMLFIVPYVSTSLKGKGASKKDRMLVTGLVLVVWVITIALAYLYITNPMETYAAKLGAAVYNLDAMNPAIEWTLFTILGFARGFVEMKAAGSAS